jgi:hypothetical protein
MTVAQPKPEKENDLLIEHSSLRKSIEPLNMRDILKAAPDPLLVNCPNDISKKNKGVPIKK